MQKSKMILTVSQINTYIKSVMDGDFLLKNVYIQGEISNFKNHTASGHYYFSLKDNNSVIQAAMFKRENSRLKFMPENGMGVILRGRISAYEKSGTYSIYVDEMQPQGIGELYLAFEQLKAKFEKEGLFSPSNKKPIPKYPSKIAVITSATGAAINDITNILSRRYPIAEIIVLPVLVQGEMSAESLTAAVEKCNAEKMADVIILGRGGGSIEDLWSFNDEKLARAIFLSDIPIISAVGHEHDFTIADFVADVRASTPSAAAEIAVADASNILYDIDLYRKRLSNAMTNIIRNKENQLKMITQNRVLSDPIFSVRERQIFIDLLNQRMENSYKSILKYNSERFAVLITKLSSLNPLAVLARGYSVTYKNGAVLESKKDVSPDDEIVVKVHDGEIKCVVTEV